MRNLFYASWIIFLLALSGSLAYYFLIHLPRKEELKATISQQEAQFASDNQAKFGECISVIDKAMQDYSTKRPTVADFELAMDIAEQRKADCYRLYGN